MRVQSQRKGRAYAAIPNAMMRDAALSIEARGMLALMMTYSDDWMFFRSHLMQTASIGREKFQRIMKELSDAGHVSLEVVRDENGSVRGKTYLIHDVPNNSTEGLKTRPSADDHRGTGFPTVGKPDGRKTRPYKKTNQQEDQEGKKTKDSLFGDLPMRELGGEGYRYGPEHLLPSTSEKDDDPFERWWALYPDRPNNPKKPAKAKFAAALKKIGLEELLARTAAYAETRKGEDPKFTPMASTWLNQERWENFAPKAKATFNPDNPLEGLPDGFLSAVRLELNADRRREMALEYWRKKGVAA